MRRLGCMLAMAATACGPQVIHVRIVGADASVDAAPEVAPVAAVRRVAWDARPPFCAEALGRVDVPGGGWCAGVLVEPRRVLTTTGCLLDELGRERPVAGVTFTPHGASGGVEVTRVVRGRDADDHRAGGGWAALILAAPVVGRRPVPVEPSVGAAERVVVASYVDAAGRTLGLAEDCSLRRYDDDSLAYDCPLGATASGGAIVRCGSEGAALRAIAARADDPRERARYNAVPLRWYAQAPLGATAIGVGPSGSFGPFVYAIDAEAGRVYVRSSGDEASPWWTQDSLARPAARLVAGAAINTWGAPFLFVVEGESRESRLWTEPHTVTDFRYVEASGPIPGAAPVLGVAMTGDLVDRLQMYALDADGRVYARCKMSDDPFAPWADWIVVGTLPGARQVAAVSFGSPRTRLLVVATAQAVYQNWSTGFGPGSWTQGSGAWLRVDGVASGESLALTAGVGSDGRAFLARAVASGEVRVTWRAAGGASWSPETALAARLPAGVRALAATTGPDGRSLLVALAGVAPGAAAGEIFALDEQRATGDFAPRWTRLYR